MLFLKMLLCILCILLVVVVSGEKELTGLIMFHRHGDRTPYYFMPNDVENNQVWKDGQGILTNQGLKQMEKLGGLLRERYVLGKPYRLLEDGFNRTEFVTRSTDVDRTIESAESLLMGLFPPGTGPKDGLSHRYQIVPIRTMPLGSDNLLLAFENYNCARLKDVREDVIKKGDVWKQKEKETAEFLQRLTEISGYPEGTLTLATISYVADPLFCERAHGMKWLDAFEEDPSLFERSASLLGWVYHQLYASTMELRRLTGGNMIAQIISRFQKLAGKPVTVPLLPTKDTPVLADGTFSNSVKVTHFSAHDTTLVSLLSALGKFDDENPPYASTIVFELFHDPSDDSYSISAFYNKGINSLFENQLMELSLADFVEQFTPLVPTDYGNECKPKQDQNAAPVSLCGTNGRLLVSGTFFTILSCFIIFYLMQRTNINNPRGPKSRSYEQIIETI